LKTIYKIIATFFGAGYIPFAPGTFGAFFGCIFLWLCDQFKFISFYKNPLVLVAMILFATTLGIFVSNKLEKEWGKDASKIVIDEAVGLWVTMLFVPFNWLNILLAFGLFRFFDIAKPFGVRKLENLKGGLGVMADDILAGIYANIILQIILFIL